MGETWFTADTHFGHANIIKYCNRPFTSVEEMDEAMIERWNERVKPNDVVWHLGDFAFYKSYEKLEQIFNRLNGNKLLIHGNHDYHNTQRLFWLAQRQMDTILFGKQSIVLCHYGMRVWHRSHQGALHLYGHSHGTLPGDSQSLDVGVDCWDFRPANIDEIRARLKTLPARPKEF